MAAKLRIWRVATQFLVERPGGVFELVGAFGAIERRFTPSDWAIEDELGKVVHVVEKDSLVEQTTLQHGSTTKYDEDVKLEGLVLDSSPETARFIQTVLDDQVVAAEEARLKAIREADARIAAIEGAEAGYPLGGDFARAQRALIERIRRWPDELASSLLATLVSVARADVNRVVIDLYVRACLIACFERPIPEVSVEGEPVPTPALAAELVARAVDLDQHGDCQERVDANITANAYWHASRVVREAARLLGA